MQRHDNDTGYHLAIEVFPGNTQDTKTFASQVDKVATRFGGGEITFVGDRGMIKGPQIKALHKEGVHFITAITNPQIEALLTQGILRMGSANLELRPVNMRLESRPCFRGGHDGLQCHPRARQALA